MESLEHFDLDLVIAGFTSNTPWAKEIGFTRPYFEEQIAIGVPHSMQVPAKASGLRVAVVEGALTETYLKKKGAVPVPAPDISQVNGPVAAPVWQLRQLGFTVTRFRLLESKHVMATPPGENGWLKCLQDFLEAHRSNVEMLLEQTKTRT